MKKYVKPELFYEHYELSEHIADCLWEWHNDTIKEVCVAIPDKKLDMDGFGGIPDMVFSENPSCNMPPEYAEMYCYTSVVVDANLFKS